MKGFFTGGWSRGILISLLQSFLKFHDSLAQLRNCKCRRAKLLLQNCIFLMALGVKRLPTLRLAAKMHHFCFSLPQAQLISLASLIMLLVVQRGKLLLILPASPACWWRIWGTRQGERRGRFLLILRLIEGELTRRIRAAFGGPRLRVLLSLYAAHLSTLLLVTIVSE